MVLLHGTIPKPDHTSLGGHSAPCSFATHAAGGCGDIKRCYEVSIKKKNLHKNNYVTSCHLTGGAFSSNVWELLDVMGMGLWWGPHLSDFTCCTA